MQRAIARTVSVILHPLIMPAIGLLLLLNSGTYLEFLTFPQKRAIFLILLIGTTLLPLTLIPVIILQRNKAGLAMESHRERVMPMFITVIFYGFTWHMLSRLNVPSLISTYAITGTVTLLVCSLVTFRWKISLHMTAQGALAGAILAVAFRHGVNLQVYLSLLFLCGGLTGWSRLKLGAHTPAQIYVGYLTGLAIAFLLMFNF